MGPIAILSILGKKALKESLITIALDDFAIINVSDESTVHYQKIGNKYYLKYYYYSIPEGGGDYHIIVLNIDTNYEGLFIPNLTGHNKITKFDLEKSQEYWDPYIDFKLVDPSTNKIEPDQYKE